jgi:transposase-like protein
MNKSHKPEQIVRMLQDVQAQLATGMSQGDVARQLGINPGTLSRWRRRYGGIQIDEAKKIVFLEKENVRLKRIVAELELDRSILKEALEGKY